jgi:hypothetical protein
LLSIVAARATGETDVTPIGAMGKITQLVYGYVAPSNMTTNLMTASITAAAASHSAGRRWRCARPVRRGWPEAQLRRDFVRRRRAAQSIA